MKIIKPNILVSLTEFPDQERSGTYQINNIILNNFNY